MILNVLVNKAGPKSFFVAMGAAVIVAITLWAWLRRTDPTQGDMKNLTFSAAAGDTNALAVLNRLGPATVPRLEELCRYNDLWRSLVWGVAPILPKKMGQNLVARVGPLCDVSMRVAAIKVLGMMRSKAKPAIPTLQMILHDPQPYIALAAAGSLANIGAESVPGLISALNDSSASVRHAAAYGLGELGPAARAAIPALVTRLKDPDPQVRASSAYSLTRVGSGELHKSRVVDQAANTERQTR